MTVKTDIGTIMLTPRETNSILREFINTMICSLFQATIHITLTTISQGSSKCGDYLHMEFRSTYSGELKTERASKIFGITYCCREFTSSTCGYQLSVLKLKKDSNWDETNGLEYSY